ncbi:M96 mating-specific protein family [Phytophthora palmivora]|uniref:M96 mating-specific protein family n=1 Tax=Phytophthora palmivora TaxID=4796 RepID=A0A2P4XJY7_9STRA|nr:M96 mating-specific protein family [Phytophthora palmivora]
MEHKMTTKRPVGYTPRWNEMMQFEGLPAAVGTLRVDVMQEERIGADEVVGTFILPLSRLQDQRLMEKWHVLKKQDKDTISEMLLSCRFLRSPISAVELELELLQNQANELHLFLGRHQNLVLSTPEPRDSMVSNKPLQGKEVVPEETPERSTSTRFSAVASFSSTSRKRESVENVSMNVEMHEAPRVKRHRGLDTEKQVNSLSDRIANWLLPAAPSTSTVPCAKPDLTPQQGVFTGENGGRMPSQFFPFKQRQGAPAQRRPRRTGRSNSATPQKPPSALQTIEKWLFTDKDGNPRELPFGRQAPSY